MDIANSIQQLRRGERISFPDAAQSLDFVQSLDADDQLINFREDFVIPSKTHMTRKALDVEPEASEECIYFCGNSLGLPAKVTQEYVNAYLKTWGSIGVKGHFTALENSPIPPFQDMSEELAKKTAPLFGADPSEITIMNTLTANLHFLMASFYRPSGQRNKILLEWRPFPSDWYAIESQIEWHGLKPKDAMVLVEPDQGDYYISTAHVLSLIDKHKDELALVLLPGIQYYSGQLLDIETITRHAQGYGITVGWDLAHAAGNVEVKLHEWNVDFACWCTYKYMNSGAGAIAGAFVHERHGHVTKEESDGTLSYHPRLKGWYGGDKSVRFLMDNKYVPIPGAGGFQLSNPSGIDMTCYAASLSVFNKTSMEAIRSKSLLLTAYAEHMLKQISSEWDENELPFKIISPADPRERGAQLSVLLREELFENVAATLESSGVICDKRKPGVIRVAPAPLYNTFTDVWKFSQIFKKALRGDKMVNGHS